jgi:hypothetical protein
MVETKSTANASRSETVTVRLEPKLRYLAEIAAREQHRTLSSFIEWSIRRALTQGELLEEPNYGANMEAKRQTPPMWGEGFWDVDEGERFLLLATGRPDLLTTSEQQVWKAMGLKLKSGFGRKEFLKLWAELNDDSKAGKDK